jgi:hypothetical protein
MNLRRLRARGLAAIAALSLASGVGYAADATAPPPPPVMADPAVATDCPTCSGDPAGRKPFFEHVGHGQLLGHIHAKKITVPTLCPGACFGYFQTKWNRWEDVCSHYYQGINVSDAPKAPIPAAKTPIGAKAPPATTTVPMPMPNPTVPVPSPLPAPSTVPNPMGTIPVPPISAPTPPSTKFAP